MKNRLNNRAWLYYAMITTVLWGIQAYIMKFAGDIKKVGSMKAESFVFYTMVSSLLLVPVITVILSLILCVVIPHPVIITGMVLAFIAIYLMAE